MTVTDIKYRYFLTDLLTNITLAEIPFKNVSYERVNRKAGSFSGTIPFIEETRGLDLYESTMPGRTGIYVTRNGVCVWGGILWSRTYNARERTLTVEGSEFMSYFYHRQIWQTLIYGSPYSGIATYQVSSGIATITTGTVIWETQGEVTTNVTYPEDHPFKVGDLIRITMTNDAINGDHEVLSVFRNAPTEYGFTFATNSPNIGSTRNKTGSCRKIVDTYDVARDLIDQVSKDFGNLNFANETIKPAKEYEVGLSSAARSGGRAILRTTEPHTLIPGQEIEILNVGSGLDGIHNVVETPDSVSLTIDSVGADTALSLSGLNKVAVTTKAASNGVVTLTTNVNHGLSVGDSVFIQGVDNFNTKKYNAAFDGRFTLIAPTSGTTLTYSISSVLLEVPSQTSDGGYLYVGPKIVYGDYGSYTSNSDLGIGFDDITLKSGFYNDTQEYRGYENKTVGETLEAFSNTVDGGFEYRIDCDYDVDKQAFTRTFKVLPIELAKKPNTGEFYTAEELGADKLVFEFPGNISDFSVQESAENAATRFFAVGKIGDLGNNISQPYAGVSDRELLSNQTGKSWPLLDQVEVLDEQSDEVSLYGYAQDFLYESKPPIGTYTLSINGSLDPVVGTYSPGDWCSLIIDDEFVLQRLANDQEPRDDILIRKIKSFKVSVPDTPTFPEQVELTLATDWKVDKRGD